MSAKVIFASRRRQNRGARDHHGPRQIVASSSRKEAFPHGGGSDSWHLDGAWSTFQGKNLCRRAQIKTLKHAWVQNDRAVAPFVSDMPGNMSGESAATLRRFCLVPARARRGDLRGGSGGMVLGQTTAPTRCFQDRRGRGRQRPIGRRVALGWGGGGGRHRGAGGAARGVEAGRGHLYSPAPDSPGGGTARSWRRQSVPSADGMRA